MATKRVNFDWSILTRKGLSEMLWQIHPEIIDQRLTIDQIKRKLSKQIKTYLPIRVSKKPDTSVDSGWIYVGGVYYSDWDQQKKLCIEVNFAYNPKDKYIIIDKKKFTHMCRIFSDVVLHEIIHMRQYRRRKFKPIPDYESNAEKDELRQEQGYLGCTDEIDAYSFNIACELLEKFKGNKPEVIKYIGKHHRRGFIRSQSFRSYLKAFEYNHNHPILRRLKKRIIRYLPHAEQGKPYRTKDWINR